MDTKKWKYTNPDTGETEEVALERWIWGAVFEDGTEMHQFDDNGIFHRIGEIEQSKVVMWVLYQPQGMGDGRIDFIVPREEDGSLKEVALIHKYRNFIFAAGSPEETRVRAYVFGFKLKGQKSLYNFVMPNGTIVQSTEENPALSKFVLK